MSSFHVRHKWILLISLLIAGSTKATFAYDCKPTQWVQLESASYFNNIRAKSDKPDADRWASTFRLPAANECEVEGDEHNTAGSLQCTWYMDKGPSNENRAKDAYTKLVASLASCLSKTEDQIRRKQNKETGESASIDDPYPNMPINAYRTAKVSYEYTDGRWVITLKYSIDDGDPN
jgi:hypothetical protein